MAGRWILERVGSERESVRVDSEVTMGRGLGVTHRIVARSCPLMVSRNHCTFRITSEGHCLVIDNQSLNGVWVNGERIEPQQPHRLSEGDVIQLGVPLREKERAEYEYRLTQRDREQEEAGARGTDRAKASARVKRKHSRDHVEPQDTDGTQCYTNKIQRLCQSNTSDMGTSQDTQRLTAGTDPGTSRDRQRLTAGTDPGTSRDTQRLTAGTDPGTSRDRQRLTAGTDPGTSRDRQRLTAGTDPGTSRDGQRLTAGTDPGTSRDRQRLTAGTDPGTSRDRQRLTAGTDPGTSRDRQRLTAGTDPGTSRDRQRLTAGTDPGPTRDRQRLTAGTDPGTSRDRQRLTAGTDPGTSRDRQRLTAGTDPGPTRDRQRLTAGTDPGPSMMRKTCIQSCPSGTLRAIPGVQADALSVPGESDSHVEELAASVEGLQELQGKLPKSLPTEQQERKVKVHRDQAAAQLTDVLENELQCIICSEHFIEAVTLNCSHSFCCHCILEWRKRKEECPICRQPIHTQSRSVVLDNCIERMLENLTEAMRERRKQLLRERKALKTKPVSVPDSESSSCDDLTSLQSVSTLDSSELAGDSEEGDTDDNPPSLLQHLTHS
ncbi:E3 ubiquitin-protein ligase rnf8-like isoform X2 [Hemiscyllium ocellatum]|uniref:E3 ubiquitin-protein ligase rnf8-like isoform X2 n=1 Tax=Hemiscyllium ocellatum TaxID=170820 RepID=UPI002966D0DB|nr:E3 ubiquitin-protein ligase rnf8-like isoform X2 [Hemiscyllium ocellatum]